MPINCSRNTKAFICIILATIVLAVFRNVPEFGFLGYDDNIYVTKNHHVLAGLTWESMRWAFTSLEAGFWHPLTWLSLMLDQELYGMHAGGYHGTNVLLHLGNTLLLFLALMRMTGAPWRSGLVAALFALHPLHVESVAWIAQRKDVLSTFFWMLTLLCYVRYVEGPGWQRYLPVMVVFILGLMSKAMLVTLPCVLLLLDYWPLGRLRYGGSMVNRRRLMINERSISYLLLEKMPLVILSVLSIGLTFYAERGIGAVAALQNLPLDTRIANAFTSYVIYIYMTLWPLDLAVFYPHPGSLPWWQTVSAFLILGGISACIFFNAKKHPYLAVGWLWYLVTLIPVIGIIQIGAHAYADRYTYVPLIGIFIMSAWIVPGKVNIFWKRMTWAVAVGALALTGYLSFIHAGYWQNDLTLFRHALTVTEGNYVAEGLYATALIERRHTQEGLVHYQKALAIKPNYEPAYYGLAVYFQRVGKYDEAILNYRHFLAIDPKHAGAHENLAVIYTQRGDYPKAVFHYREAINIDPTNAALYNKLGNALRKDKREEEAIIAYGEAIRLQPRHAGAHNNIAMILLRKGKTEAAIGHFRQALILQPEYANAHYYLSAALRKQGKWQEARQHEDRAGQINPAYQRKHKDDHEQE